MESVRTVVQEKYVMEHARCFLVNVDHHAESQPFTLLTEPCTSRSSTTGN